MESLFFLLIALVASVIGSICGVGGGVLMKPVLDLSGLASVSTASFLSSMTVLAMTGYTTANNLLSENNDLALKKVAPLALGAASGGVVGKLLFETLKSILPNADKVGAVQAVCLGVVAIATALYTLHKDSIHTLSIQSAAVCVFIGIVLGIMSSFLGIGGGPIDLVVLLFFFSMDTKIAVQNSLFVILFSQMFSLFYTLASGNVPDFSLFSLILMIMGGIGGGIIGKRLSRRLDNNVVDKLFIALLVIIALISVYNFCKYV